MKKNIKLWWLLSLRAATIALSSRFGAAILILGKIIRFFFFLIFLLVLLSKIQTLAGYSGWQVTFFFLTFNLIDTVIQLLLREVYRFRGYVVNGEFDYFLLRPWSPLVRSLFGGSDILDLPMLIIFLCGIFYIAPKIGPITFMHSFWYVLFIINAFFVGLAFHIIVLGLGILTTEVDNAIFVYRDITQMARVPIDIYKEPLRGIITFVIPVGIMMAFPAKAFMGLLSPFFFILAISFSSFLLIIGYSFWRYAIRFYTSASS